MACAISMHRSALEVDQKSRDRAVTVTFKSAVHAAMMGTWGILGQVFERHSSNALAMSCDIWLIYVRAPSSRRLGGV